MHVFVIFFCVCVYVSCPQAYNGEKDKEKKLSQTPQSIAASIVIVHYSVKNSVWLSKH